MPGRFWPAWPESNGPEGAPGRDQGVSPMEMDHASRWP